MTKNRIPFWAVYIVYALILESAFCLGILFIPGLGSDTTWVSIAVTLAMIAPITAVLLPWRKGAKWKDYTEKWLGFIDLIREHCFFCVLWYIVYFFLCSNISTSLSFEGCFLYFFFLDFQWDYTPANLVPNLLSLLFNAFTRYEGKIFCTVLLALVLPALPRWKIHTPTA